VTAAGSGADGAVLVIDSATTRIVVGLASPAGAIRAVHAWDAGYRHGETLLPAIERVLVEAGLDRSRLTAIVVGTGPGAFTGLRVGIATAKGLAHGLRRPLVGISTAEALLAAAMASPRPDAGGSPVLLLPAGAADRIVVRAGARPTLLAGGRDPDLAHGEWLVAVDLDGRAPVDAVDRGEVARTRLGEELAALGTARLRDGRPDDLAGLVPEYVTLPRGISRESGEVAWSRDLR
jgi:tRNA threonylcarbamoyladenosine biosynthesis protein TsaB